jgi:phthalate 4,5-cis-dihydrodiol dehydrogenase
MPPLLRIGIDGLGVASTQILPAVVNHPTVRLAGACDIRPDALEKFRREFHVEAYSSIEALCSSETVDAVYVCTPNHLHADHVIIAAEHRKHVIVEKPMALSIEECEAMNAAAARNGVQILCGHTHSFDPPIRKMRELVVGGQYGRLGMIHTWNYTDLLYRPRMAHELNPKLGGNAVFNQGPHQVDVVRLIGGGMVRSVRGMTAIWDPERRAEGAYTAYLEFEDGTPATVVYNGYGHFDTAELHYWVGEGGQPRDPETNAKSFAALQSMGDQETMLKEAMRFGGAREGGFAHLRDAKVERHQPFFGVTLVSCEKADVRQSPDGLYVYTSKGKDEITLPIGLGGREAEFDELYQAVVHDQPVQHDGHWGEATLEVVLAIQESARERREIILGHQVPSPE